jgi:hypothetical protein
LANIAHGYEKAEEYNPDIMSADKRALFPIAYGNEEETMLQVGPEGASYKEYAEATEFMASFEEYIPKELKHVPEMKRRHMQNGGVVYHGGGGGANLERTTPECSTPTEYANAVQANEQLLVAMVGNYIRDKYRQNEPTVARIQRRTMDSYSNGRASHDSLEIRRPSLLREGERYRTTKTLMLAHIATRSFMTGAGYLSNYSAYYGAKLSNLHIMESYGYSNSAFRVNETNDTGYRWEIRCNDVNLSPWALKVRSAGSAVLFAAAQTELGRDLLAVVPSSLRDEDNFLHVTTLFNRMKLNEEGQLLPQANDVIKSNFQEQIFTILAERFGKYADVDDEYRMLMEEIIQYCQDYRKVLRGEADWKLLMDRSDVAAKFSKIAASLQRSRDIGEDRSITDAKSRGWDLRYDHIEISPGVRGAPRVEYGYGYKLRDKGHFRQKLDDVAVERALYRPPTTTRAHIRGELIRRGLVADCHYSSVKFRGDKKLPSHLANTSFWLGGVVLRPGESAMSANEYIELLANHKQD